MDQDIQQEKQSFSSVQPLGKLQRLWELFQNQNLFAKLSVLFLAIITLGTPAFIAERQILSSHASNGQTTCIEPPPCVTNGTCPNIASVSQVNWCNSSSHQGIHKIKHIVIIMQENRSFDSYFGTFPGANGLPKDTSGNFTVCIPDPKAGNCQHPYHNTTDQNYGGPHAEDSAIADINNGKMDGFIADVEKNWQPCSIPDDPNCIGKTIDVMGYHDATEIPNYWSYAKSFVLQDNMFEPVKSWSSPAHLFLVSGWSAKCSQKGNPLSCTNAPGNPNPDLPPPWSSPSNPPDYAWTDLTYLLHKNNISWAYYVMNGTEPDCEDDNAATCIQHTLSAKTPGIWNPLPYFDTVHQDNETNNVQSLNNFFTALKDNTLPAVSWITPSNEVSEHPPALISNGQAYTTTLINAIMKSSAWDNTAIFVSWDDWGGFYDHVNPPTIDGNGYGLRVPGIVISPYAKKGYIDHQLLSHDAYMKFIEDDFLSSQRIDPKTDGRPDNRTDVREANPQLGDLVKDFDFSQPPQSPFLLPTHPTQETFIYRLHKPYLHDYVYTGNPSVFSSLTQNGYRVEATAFDTYTAAGAEKDIVPVYELQKQYTYPNGPAGAAPAKDHFYTINKDEITKAEENGYILDGIPFYAYSSQNAFDQPVYHLTAFDGKTNFYTQSESDKNIAMNQYKFTYVGISWYSLPMTNETVTITGPTPVRVNTGSTSTIPTNSPHPTGLPPIGSQPSLR